MIDTQGSGVKRRTGNRTGEKASSPLTKVEMRVAKPVQNNTADKLKMTKEKADTTGTTGSTGSYGSYGSYGSNGNGSGNGSSASDLAAKQAAERAAAQAAALKAAQQARLDAVNAANNALNDQGKAMEAQYMASLDTLGNDYQKLRNQSEVNRYRAMINQREALANRGALDSGVGRQENLILSNNYNNNLNDINLQEAAERAKVMNNIQQMWATVKQQQAQNQASTINDYANNLQNLIAAQYSGYNPENSDYYAAARNALGETTPTVQYMPYNSTMTTPATGADNAYTQLLRALGSGQYVR